jgi:two-component system nitrate/nitrite response regulator NarL
MNLFVCDDHRLFAESLTHLLEARGHRVMWADRPEQAAHAAATEEIDVFLMDLHFPSGDSVDAIREIRSLAPLSRILVLSACSDPVLISRAIAAGAAGVAAKDDGVDQILRIIENVRLGDAVVSSDTLHAIVRSVRDARQGDQRLDGLTAREREVLDHLVRGQATTLLAKNLGVTYSTARTHIQNVLSKLAVHSRLEAVALVVSRPPGDGTRAHRATNGATHECRAPQPTRR